MQGAITKATAKRQERRQRLRCSTERAAKRGNAGGDRGKHGNDADRIDVVEMRTLEFDAGRTQSQRLVDDEVGNQRADPGDRDDRIETEHVLEHLEDAELHQQQRDSHIEHQPHHAAGMAMREPRKEIRPGDRARIGVGDIDLELGDDDESAGKSQRHLRRGEDIPERRRDTSASVRRPCPAARSARPRERPGRSPRAISTCRERSSPDRPPDRRPTSRPCGDPRAGRKRRKSTCSPICAISENTTVAAVPNRKRLNEPPSVAGHSGKMRPPLE